MKKQKEITTLQKHMVEKLYAWCFTLLFENYKITKLTMYKHCELRKLM